MANSSQSYKILFSFLFCLLLCFMTVPAQASFYKDKRIQFFPVPVFETRPDKGQSYGLLPVVLFSDKDSEAISLILAALGQYNTIAKATGAAIAYYYPNPVTSPEEVFDFYFEYAQVVSREATLHYLNPRLKDKFYLESFFSWIQSPYGRFYGYGADSAKAAESSYVAEDVHSKITFGYYIKDNLRISLREHFLKSHLENGIINNTQNLLTLFANTEGVANSTTLLNGIALTYDSRPQGNNSRKGLFFEGTYFFTLPEVINQNMIQGFSLENIALIPWLHGKTVTALRLFIKDIFGTALPFYWQSQLGGPNDLRSFIPGRFTDNSEIILSFEQRITVLSTRIFGVPVQLNTTPFFEVGRVFHHFNNFGFSNLQPVVGLGIRGIVPPNVVARIDTAVGREGYAVYTMLGYAF